MNNEEKILTMLESLVTKVDKLEQAQAGTNKRLDTMQGDISAIKEDIEEMKEDAAITCEASNLLLDWATEIDPAMLEAARQRRSTLATME